MSGTMRLRDDGVRMAVAGRSRGPDRSDVQKRAQRHESGAWSEDLGIRVYGEESWILPGKGEEGANCGEYVPDEVCPSCGKVHFASHSCGARSCPECWGLWSRDASMRATVRIQAFRYTQPNDWHRQMVHSVYSPEQGSIQTVRDYREMVKRAYELAKEKGMRGGAAVPHGYRPEEETKEEFEREDPDGGIWRFIRENDTPWREQVYWSPHVHLIGATTPDMEPGDDETGEVWNVIRSFDRFDLYDEENYEDVYGALRYLLSHATFHEEESMQVVRWWGCMANNSFTGDEWPSDGIVSKIEGTVEDVADAPLVEDDEEEGAGGDEDDEETGECEACGEDTIDVLDVPAHLRRNDPPPEVRERMNLAYEWRTDKIAPPPGLKHPRSEEDAREAFGVMLSE